MLSHLPPYITWWGDWASGCVDIWLWAKVMHYPSRWQNSILPMFCRNLRLVQYNVQLLYLPCGTKAFSDSSLSYRGNAFKLISFGWRNWKLFLFRCFCGEEEMKIITQCDDYSGSDGVIQEQTTLLLSLEYETNCSVLTKAHHKKQYFNMKHRRKTFCPSRKLQKANLRSEYLPTISKSLQHTSRVLEYIQNHESPISNSTAVCDKCQDFNGVCQWKSNIGLFIIKVYQWGRCENCNIVSKDGPLCSYFPCQVKYQY